VHFILALGVFFIYLLILGTPIIATWWMLPIVVFIQLMLNLGVAFFVSCLNVFYEDIKYVATVVLGLLFYATPIVYLSEQIYQSAMIPEPWRALAIKALWLNPLSRHPDGLPVSRPRRADLVPVLRGGLCILQQSQVDLRRAGVGRL
jgi:ABC-type polysaccharide/polyol phosphate export permease